MGKSLLILGTGGHARVVAETAEELISWMIIRNMQSKEWKIWK